jgi:uncharacterized SAM-binding protein YcdF (DUF218 family)
MTPPDTQKHLKPTRRPLRRFFRFLGYALLIVLAWCGVISGRIIYLGSHDYAEKSDVIIVLGAAVRKRQPSPAFAGRIRHGIELQKRGLAPMIIFTGGLGHDGLIPEAQVAREVALREGIAESAVLTETVSTKTWENFTEAARLMRENGLKRAIIVSDPYHLHRARLMAGHAGIEAVTSPTPYTAFQTWQTKVPFLLNEVRLFHSHWMFRASGER